MATLYHTKFNRDERDVEGQVNGTRQGLVQLFQTMTTRRFSKVLFRFNGGSSAGRVVTEWRSAVTLMGMSVIYTLLNII